MKFDLDEEQSDIRDMVRRFTEQEITPHAEAWDEQEYFPREVYTKMADLGLMGMTTPEEYGGSALSRLTGALAYEELAKGEMATAVGLSVHNMVAGSIARFGKEQQRRRWVSKLASGELLGAFSLSEAAAGSDAASLQCRAENQGDRYLVNGSKMWVTNAGEADIYLLMARTSESKGSMGISCFVVEKGTPGFSFGKKERKMGLHSSPTRELLFEDCTIPTANRIGEEGQGFKIALSSLDGGRINIGAVAVGVAQAAFETAARYARTREQFNQPIGAFQGVQFLLADMATRLESARLLAYHAAWLCSLGRPFTRQASMAKLHCTDTAMQLALDALQLAGDEGTVSGSPFERHVRDAKALQIYEGSNQVQRIVIAREVLR